MLSSINLTLFDYQEEYLMVQENLLTVAQLY